MLAFPVMVAAIVAVLPLAQHSDDEAVVLTVQAQRSNHPGAD